MEDAQRILGKLDEVQKTQSETNVEVAGLKATVEISVEQHAGQIKELFDMRKHHERRLAAVEASYVQRADCRAEHDKNEVAHKEFRDATDEQRTFSGKVFGATIVVALIVSAVAAWALSKLEG